MEQPAWRQAADLFLDRGDKLVNLRDDSGEMLGSARLHGCNLFCRRVGLPDCIFPKLSYFERSPGEVVIGF
jgi:hypothetical protein